MQIPMHTSSGVEAYVADREWRVAKLSACPLHPSGGCGFARHGSYARVKPSGVRVARWYCPQGRRTFSLLPDFLAARLPGLLAEVEEAIFTATRSPSIEVAAASMRDLEVSLPAAVRWLRRRLGPVRRAIRALRDTGIDVAVVVDAGFLVGLRLGLDDQALAQLPPPLGFGLRSHGRHAVEGRQHKMGPDAHERTNYCGRQHTLPPFVWSPDPTEPCNPNARPPPRTSYACGAQTAASARVARSNTCNGSGDSDATATCSVLTKPAS